MKYLTWIAVLTFGALISSGQTPDSVTGKWISEEKNAKIEIYESDGRYLGKLVWIKDLYEADGRTLRKDIRNKDPELRKRPLLNAVLFTGFRFEDYKWVDGKVYDPRSGRTYSAEMKLNGNKLELRGYIGNPVFGRTAIFTRE